MAGVRVAYFLVGVGHRPCVIAPWPTLAEAAPGLARCDHDDEFEFALAMIGEVVTRRAGER
ncbi:hypothetical protein [Micromonospora sp. NPDC047074]|uniref:hypothetical protein n=1 Tax=Micromonospora sp. NPDC047074 TaxID=3154339 RepID=UPI0033FD7676